MNEEILETIKNFLDLHQYSNFTLDDLRIFLTKKLGQVDVLSNSTIGRWIKSKFNMSFKKINNVNPKVFDSESRRKMLEAAALQIKLISKGWEVIYIVEFKYSSRKSDLYGWTLKGRSGYRKEISSEFQAYLIVAFSMKRIIGVWATAKTYNATKFKYFLKQLSNFKENDFALICDNARIHVANYVQKFLVKRKLWITTIPAYCPFINAWKKLILIVKSKIRKIERQGNQISLRSFKKWFDSIKVS